MWRLEFIHRKYVGARTQESPPSVFVRSSRLLAPITIVLLLEQDTMIACGLQADSGDARASELPWPNASNHWHGMPFYQNHTREDIVDQFCKCISCAFLPAVEDDAAPPHIPLQCELDTPRLPTVVRTLARDLCDDTRSTGEYACPGHVWPARAACAAGGGEGGGECRAFDFALAIGAAAFDTFEQASFLGRLASLANVPIDQLYMQSVRTGSAIARVGVIAAIEPAVMSAVIEQHTAEELTTALGVPVQGVIEVPTATEAISPLLTAALVVGLLLLLLLLLSLTTRCYGLRRRCGAAKALTETQRLHAALLNATAAPAAAVPPPPTTTTTTTTTTVPPQAQPQQALHARAPHPNPSATMSSDRCSMTCAHAAYGGAQGEG